MRVLSLFDGHGIGMLALKRAGIPVDHYFASEVDRSAITIAKKNHPEIIQLGDVKNVVGSSLGKIDLLLGGSPCQGFSREGGGLNFEHPKSVLFFEYVRILGEARKINPDVKFILENVMMKKKWQDVISDHLALEPIKINSRLVSAQNRERLYWTNLDVTQPEDKGIMLQDILQKDKEVLGLTEILNTEGDYRTLGKDGVLRVNEANKKGYALILPGEGVDLSFPSSKTRRGRRMEDKCNCLTATKQDHFFWTGHVLRRFSITEMERLQTLPDGYTKGVSQNQRRKMIGNGWTTDVITHILKSL